MERDCRFYPKASSNLPKGEGGVKTSHGKGVGVRMLAPLKSQKRQSQGRLRLFLLPFVQGEEVTRYEALSDPTWRGQT